MSPVQETGPEAFAGRGCRADLQGHGILHHRLQDEERHSGCRSVGELGPKQGKRETEQRNSSHEERLETRKVLDRAKGILNNTMGLPEPEAFRWIQKASMDRRLTMREVAQTVIDQLSAKSDNPDI